MTKTPEGTITLTPEEQAKLNAPRPADPVFPEAQQITAAPSPGR